MPERARLETLCIAAIGAAAFWALQIPFLFGPMAFCLGATLLKRPLKDFGQISVAARTILGLTVGASITPEVLSRLPDMAGSVAFIPLYIITIGVIGVRFFRRICDFDKVTAYGFLRLRCGDCAHEKLVMFSCKRRGFCSACGARRMAETAAHLVEQVITRVPVRQYVVSFPIPLLYLFATQPQLLSRVLQDIHRTLSTFVIKQVGKGTGSLFDDIDSFMVDSCPEQSA